MVKYLSLFIGLLISVQSYAEKVPLEVFAKQPSFRSVKISPTGEYLAFTYEEGTEVRLAVMSTKDKKILSSFEFGEHKRVIQFDWLNHERVGMFVQKFTGWLDGANPQTIWVAANYDGSIRRGLWDFSSSSMSLLSTLDDDPEHVLVTKRHWSDGGGAKVYKVDIYSAKNDYLKLEPQSAVHSDPGIIAYGTNLKGEVTIAYEYDRGKDEISDEDDIGYLHFKAKGGSDDWSRLALPAKRKRPDVNFYGYNLDETKVYFTSNFDQADDSTLGLFEMDLSSLKITKVFRHEDVDITGGIYGPDDELIGVEYEAGYPEKFFIDPKAEGAVYLRSFMAAFPEYSVDITSMTDDKSKLLVFAYSDRDPGKFYIYDKAKKSMKYLLSIKPEVKPELMARVEPFALKARDGLKMYGQFTIPNGVELKNLPLVVYPHGGPYGVADKWGWDRRAQMLANNGYLVMQLNFRGSGDYGEEFMEAGYGEWGRKMQDDITDATLWAIKTGAADKDRICIHGVSYGGYASMNAVVAEPDLYKCSIPDAGPYDLELQWDNADTFRGANMKYKEYYIKRSIGGSENNRERSPVFHVDKVKADLFIVHGENDVRVPIENAYVLEEALKKAKKPYIKMYKEDGHGFQKLEYRLDLYKEMLKFLEKNIGK